MTDKRLSIGVCGVGSIGFRHARLLAKRPEVDLYVCDPVPAQIEAALTLGRVRAVDTFEQLLECSLQGVILATPDKYHLKQGLAACAKRVPVLLEKPIAENKTQGHQLAEGVADTGTPVLVGYALRYSETMNLAKAIVDQGDLGNPVSFQIMLGSYETLSFAKNRFSAADRDKLFADYSHEWDYLQWILGQVRRVIAVSHQSGQLELTQCPNVVDGLIEMESGVSGTVHLDYVQLPGRRRFAIVGDGGTLDVNVDMSHVSFSRRGDGFTRQYSFAEHRDALMEKQHDHFMTLIRERVPPRVNILDGLRALEVADALALSTKTGGWESLRR